jgi:hemerythrin-like domain-containing protein
MLTATYTLVALSVEQASVRFSLQSLQKLLPTNFLNQSALSAGQVSYACDALQRLFRNCHWRKIDIFLIPAMRRATAQANSLLDELDSLNDLAGQAIADVVARVNAGPIDGERAVRQFCKGIETFCDAMLTRLEREEHELFSLARTMISGEDWFAVANQMLAHDAYRQESRPARDMAASAAVPADMAEHVAAGAVWAAERRQVAWVAG